MTKLKQDIDIGERLLKNPTIFDNGHRVKGPNKFYEKKKPWKWEQECQLRKSCQRNDCNNLTLIYNQRERQSQFCEHQWRRWGQKERDN